MEILFQSMKGNTIINLHTKSFIIENLILVYSFVKSNDTQREIKCTELHKWNTLKKKYALHKWKTLKKQKY